MVKISSRIGQYFRGKIICSQIGGRLSKSLLEQCNLKDEVILEAKTVIIASMTTSGREYPTRISASFQDKKGQIVLDQLKTMDKARFVKVAGRIDDPTASSVLETLAEMFAPVLYGFKVWVKAMGAREITLT